MTGGRVAAWLVHLYTATGAVLGLFAAQNIFQYRYRAAFSWLALQMIVDATDGTLARRFRTAERASLVRGAHLDDLVDYVTYVFVPALLVWRAALVPVSWAGVVCAAMLLSSAYGFSRRDAKTTDHLFTGFPSYWNIVAFYLLLGGWPQPVNAGILCLLAVLVFVPVRYVYPSRTRELRGATITLSVVWGGVMLWMLWRMPAVPRPVFLVSLLYPLYYAVLSLWLTSRRRYRPVAGGI